MVRIRAAARTRHPRRLRRSADRTRLRGRRLRRLGDPVRRRLVLTLAGNPAHRADRSRLRLRPVPRGHHLHRRHPPGRPALLRVALRRGRPQRGRRRPRVRTAALAGTVDLRPRLPAHPAARRPLRDHPLRLRFHPRHRADRRPRDRLLRFRLLPGRGADRRRPPAPGHDPQGPPRPAARTPDAGARLRRPADPRLPDPVRRGVPDAGSRRRGHPPRPRPGGPGRGPGAGPRARHRRQR